MAGNLEAFVRGVRDVDVGGKKYDATGDNMIVADLLTDIEKEGPRTTLLSFAGVCALVLLFFRSLRTSASWPAFATAASRTRHPRSCARGSSRASGWSVTYRASY